MSKLTTQQARELFLTRNPNVKLVTQFLDPPPHKFFVFNFIPDPDAKPGQNGIFGYIKVRGGTFDTSEEAEEFSEDIIRTYDQYAVNIIHETGCPLPLFSDDQMYQNLANCQTQLIDIGSQYGGARSKFFKEAKAQDKKAREEIEQKRSDAIREEEPEDDTLLGKYAKARAKLVTLVEAAEVVIEKGGELRKQIISLMYGEKDSLGSYEEQDPCLPDNFLDYFRKIEERQGLVGASFVERGHANMLEAPKKIDSLLEKLWRVRE